MMAPPCCCYSLCFSTAFSPMRARLGPHFVFTRTRTHSHAQSRTSDHVRCSVSLLISESCIPPLMLSASPGRFIPRYRCRNAAASAPVLLKKYTYLLTSVATFQRTIKSAAAGKTPVSDLSRLVCGEEIAAGNCAEQQKQL